jgi:hypothetical protein
MKKTLLLLLMVFMGKSHAQITKKEVAFSPGIVLQREVFAEANVLFGKVEIEKGICGISGIRLGVESNLKSGDEWTIAPKAGVEASLTIMSIRLSAANYFQNGNSELRLIPEMGFSWGGFVNITYGYGLKLSNSDITNLSQHRLTLSFNINKRLTKEGLKVM